MRISAIQNIKNKQNQYYNIKPSKPEDGFTTHTHKTSTIPFYGLVKVNPLQLNIKTKTSRILNQIEEVLKDASIRNISKEKRRSFKRERNERVENYLLAKDFVSEQAQFLLDDVCLDRSMKREILASFNKMTNQDVKERMLKLPEPNPKFDNLDALLFNKFKNSILNEDFNLTPILEEYYKPLADIQTIQELKAMYPTIKIPENPVDVIAIKLRDLLTRDFYETLHHYLSLGNFDKATKISINKIYKICADNAKQFELTADDFFEKMSDPIFNQINKKYDTLLKESGRFTGIPEVRKSTQAAFTPSDKLLFNVDYEDYVLQTIKKIYLNKQKPNEITYENGTTKVALNLIKDSNYKPEKLPEKIKTIITDAAKTESMRRDYGKFDIEMLKSRLDFYANKDIAQTETILENIINFDSCRFNKEDINALKAFLQEMDSVSDKKQTIENLIKAIKSKTLTPKGTEKLNEAEIEKLAQKYKAEQEIAQNLSNLKENFDNAMNILYSNEMSDVAISLSKYRPKDLSAENFKNTDFIKNLIQQFCNEKKYITNKAQLESSILRWDTYNFYKGSDVFSDTIDEVTKIFGEATIDKVGQRLINKEIIDLYPESCENHQYKELFEKIFEKTGSKNYAALEYLEKLDDYILLEPTKKSKLIDLIDIFDMKDSIDKSILKYIIENDYSKIDTEFLIDLNNAGKDLIQAAICSKAKQAIIDKYKFPTCIQYLTAFEKAINSTANSTGSAGIKQTGRNDKSLQHKIELKIASYKDRLFSSKNDYKFDIYSEDGLH